MLTTVKSTVQLVVDKTHAILFGDNLALNIAAGLVLTAVAIAFCIATAMVYRNTLLLCRRYDFPRTAWTKHYDDVVAYNDFRKEYQVAMLAIWKAKRVNREAALKYVQHMLLIRNIDFVDFPNGTFASRVKGLPTLPAITEFDTIELPKGFRYVTNPGRFKNFRRMKHWHVFLNLLCTVPILLIELVLFVLFVEFYAMLFMPSM